MIHVVITIAFSLLLWHLSRELQALAVQLCPTQRSSRPVCGLRPKHPLASPRGLGAGQQPESQGYSSVTVGHHMSVPQFPHSLRKRLRPSLQGNYGDCVYSEVQGTQNHTLPCKKLSTQRNGSQCLSFSSFLFRQYNHSFHRTHIWYNHLGREDEGGSDIEYRHMYIYILYI